MGDRLRRREGGRGRRVVKTQSSAKHRNPLSQRQKGKK